MAINRSGLDSCDPALDSAFVPFFKRNTGIPVNIIQPPLAEFIEL